MKLNPNLKLPLRFLLGFGAGCLMPAGVNGASFAYTNCDLIACFRLAGGASDLVVNLGPATAFEGLPLGRTLPMVNVTSAQLTSAFSSLNGVMWSVLGAMRGNTNYLQFPLHTVWVTSATLGTGVPGPVWKRQGPFTLGPVASQIEQIGAGTVTYGSQQPGGPNNTATGVVISSSDQNAYTVLMTADGNLAGTFQGSVENTVPPDGNASDRFSRSLLYKLVPGAGASLNTPGQVLGFFDLQPDGALTFTAGPPRGSIAAVERHGDVFTCSFATVPAYTYRLRFTDAAGLMTPLDQWNLAGDSVIGDGAFQSLRHTNSVSMGFYALEVAP